MQTGSFHKSKMEATQIWPYVNIDHGFIYLWFFWQQWIWVIQPLTMKGINSINKHESTRDKYKIQETNTTRNNMIYPKKPLREKTTFKSSWICIWPNMAKLTDQVSLTPAHCGTLQWCHPSLCKCSITCKCLKPQIQYRRILSNAWRLDELFSCFNQYFSIN